MTEKSEAQSTSHTWNTGSFAAAAFLSFLLNPLLFIALVQLSDRFTGNAGVILWPAVLLLIADLIVVTYCVALRKYTEAAGIVAGLVVAFIAGWALLWWALGGWASNY